MTELKPCPFCGGDAKRYINLHSKIHQYQCKKCKAQGPKVVKSPVIDTAARAWNTRHKETE